MGFCCFDEVIAFRKKLVFSVSSNKPMCIMDKLAEGGYTAAAVIVKFSSYFFSSIFFVFEYMVISAHVERFSVSHMLDLSIFTNINIDLV